MNILAPTIDAVAEIKSRIRSARFKFIIKDPYPEHTAYKQQEYNRNRLEKFFKMKAEIEKPKDISIHEAWADGFAYAWELIEAELR